MADWGAFFALHRRRRQASADDVTLFTQELGWMVAAGVPLGRAIDLLLLDAGGGAMEPALRAMRAELRAGRSLAHALTGQPTLFPASYSRLIGLAETAGTLSQVLDRIHLARTNAQTLRRKIRSAMIYPAFLVTVAIAAVAVILMAVVPQLKVIAPDNAQADPSALTRLVVLSDWLTAHWLALGVAVLLCVLAAAAALRQHAIKRAVAEVLAALPVIGPVIRAMRLAELMQTLAMLTDAELPLADALRLARRTTFAPKLADALAQMEAALRAGGDVTAPLQASGQFPPLLISLIRVGMETGSIAPSLRQAAQIFDDKTRHATERALAVLEPAIILLISGVVGGIIYVIVDALMAVNDLLI